MTGEMIGRDGGIGRSAMTGLLIGLGLTALALKAAGPLAIGDQTLPGRVRQAVDSAVVAVLVVLVVV
jgi:hypothetical protein